MCMLQKSFIILRISTLSSLPSQMEDVPLHTPKGLDPSPPQVLVSDPASPKPVLQLKLATVP